MNLTDTQVYTLRRLLSGENYLLRGDAKKAVEYLSRKSAPSIPVLFRLGLVEFTNKSPVTHSKLYSVTLTTEGINCAKSKLTSRGG